MSDYEIPVSVAVRRPDGTVEHVQVGTAQRQGAGFTVQLFELTIGAASVTTTAAGPAVRAVAAPAAAAPAGGGGAGMVFPNYGRSKGMPIVGGSMQDLEYYANGCRRTLNDPAKARWHDKERVLLAAIEAEIARQRGEPAPSGGNDGPPPPSDDDNIPF